MLMFDLPVEDFESQEEVNTEQNKKKKFKLNKPKLDNLKLSKKFIIPIIILLGILVVVASILIVLNMKKIPSDTSPYCLLMKQQGKTCKIHNKKHDTDDADALIVTKGEMSLHKQLYEETLSGSYFDGKKLYRKDDAKDILTIRDNYVEEKENLFQKYLLGTATEKERERYNYLTEEIQTLEESIKALKIDEYEKEEPSKKELLEEIDKLKKQIEDLQKSTQSSNATPKGTSSVANNTSNTTSSKDQTSDLQGISPKVTYEDIKNNGVPATIQVQRDSQGKAIVNID